MSVRPVVGWENLVDKKTNQIEMKPGEEKQIIWDIKEAGPGEFRMNVEGPAWSSNTRMLPLQKVRTVFEPTVIGKYTLQVTFSSVPVKFLHVNVAEEAVSLVPKDLQCPFCMDILSAAVLLPCCVVAACYECSRNMLIESDLKCSLCFEDNISLDHLIPNPQIRKKVAEFKTKEKKETQIKLQPLPKLLSSNRVLPAEIMLQRQKEVEEEKKLVDAVLTNINGNDLSPDNLPLADTPTEIDVIDQTVCDYLNTNVESTAIQSPQAHQEDTNDSISRPSSGIDQSSSGLDQQPSSPAEISQDRIQSKSASPMVQSQSSPASTSERESTKSPSREASAVTATIPTPEADPVPDSMVRFMGSLQEMTDTSGALGARPKNKDVKINDSGDKNNLVSGQSLTATVSKSPRKDEVRSAVARGYGLTQAVMNSKAVFYVDTMVANDLPTIIILDPYNNKVAHYMSETRPRLYRVEFCPTKLGTHTVVVTQGGKNISGSPFKCEVFDPKSVRVTDIGPVVIGSECSLTVDVADAGHGALSVMVKTSGQEVRERL